MVWRFRALYIELDLKSPMNTSAGQVTISFEYSRHLGSRFVHGSVQLSFDAFRPYSYHSEAIWPEEGNYEAAIRESVETVLKEQLGSLDKVAVILKSINYDPINSCEAGFSKTARAATEAAFKV